MSFEGFSRERSTEGDESESSVAGRDEGAGSPPDGLEGPPPDVLEEMGLAAEVYERLADRGREVRFRLDPPTGRVSVEIHDLEGKMLYAIPPNRALDIASGEDIDDV
jgi:hypothetical protein